MKMLQVLGSQEFSIGLHKESVNQIYGDIISTTGVLSQLIRCVHRDCITNKDDIQALSYFIATLINNNINDSKANLELKSLAESLRDRSIDEGSRLLLQNVLFHCKPGDSSTIKAPFKGEHMDGDITCIEDMKLLEPQHDNDDPFDFRNIDILPSAAEIMTDCTMKIVQRGWLGDTDAIEMCHIDRQFRLLREDMISPLREEWKAVFDSKNLKHLHHHPRVLGFEFGYDGSMYTKIAIIPQKALGDVLTSLITKDLKIINDRTAPEKAKAQAFEKCCTALSSFFKERGRRVFERESVLLFFDANFVDEPSGKRHIDIQSTCLKFICNITERNPVAMAVSFINHGMIEVGAKFSNDATLQLCKLLMGTKHGSGKDRKVSEFVAQARTTFFSCEPVLKCLKGKSFSA
jgi:hypothetical protein